MAYYLVRAWPSWEKLPDLAQELKSGRVGELRPFGPTLNDSLRGARLDESGQAVWEEEDYCRPPLAMERDAVLDDYFSDIRVEPVTPGQGWAEIENLPSLWSRLEGVSLSPDDLAGN